MPDADYQTLQLEAFLNGRSTSLVAEFRQTKDGRFLCRRGELKQIGIKWPAAGPDEEYIDLSRSGIVKVRYDAAAQQMHLELGDDVRERKVIDAAPGAKINLQPQRDYGGALNYNLYAAASAASARDRLRLGRPTFDGVNASLDANYFTPMGSLNVTGIVGTTTFSNTDALRLDTSWTYSDTDTAITYRAGDLITGGLAWTRPVRLGGFQAQRNFAVRPDLVTAALPQFSGSAAVPSVVDVYVNGTKSYSQDVGAGPFQINNLPVVTGAGEARVVVRDASGREVETKGSFYVSSNLLREGLTDFSLEAGMPRLRYGINSFDYLDKPAASASVRHGLTDAITLEGHAEGGAGLLNLGAGLSMRLADLGVISIAGAASNYDGKNGALGYAAFEAQAYGISFRGSAQHTFGDYNDLASITAIDANHIAAINTAGDAATAASLRLNGKTPKALDTFSVGIPLGFDKSSLSLSFIHLLTADSRRSEIINASYMRPFYFGGTFALSAFTDLADSSNSGIYASVSFPLGVDATLTAGVANSNGRTSVVSEYMKPIGSLPGSYGYRVRDSEGDVVQREATGAYRSEYARIEAGVTQYGTRTQAHAEIEGSLATIGGKVYAANRIDDSFAVVSTGVPDVDVSVENRVVGRTSADGTLLVTGLRSFQENAIEIDPSRLPVTADVPKSKTRVMPADRGGVMVDLSVKADTPAAIVILKRPDGRFVPAGSSVPSLDPGNPAIVGYDGRVFLKGLQASNQIHVEADGGDCNASFTFKPQTGRQVVIGPVVCQ